MILECIVIIFLVLLLMCLQYEKVIQKYNKGIEKLPGPLRLPLFGHSFTFGYNLTAIFKRLHNMHAEFGSTYKLWPIYMKPVIVTCDIDIISSLLTSVKWINKARDYHIFLKPWLGTGLLISSGEKWHRRRKLITPAFHFQVLEQFAETFSKEADTLVAVFDEYADKPSTDIYPIINKCALDIICKTAMATDMKTQSGENVRYLRAVKEMLRIMGVRVFSVVKTFDITFKMTLDYLRQKKTIKVLHNFTNSVITNRREELKEQESSGDGKKRKAAFLDLLITAKEEGLPLTNEDIREEVDTFLFEGFDTVSSALSFTLYEIARHPAVQEEIVEEVTSVLGDTCEESFTLEKINRLKYVGQVIKEGLRLYPPVAIFERELQDTFGVGEYSFPPKTTIIVNAFSLHRQRQYFENPEEFQPERFHDDLAGKHPFCYLPFSGGPRNCIGQRFAMNEMKVVIAKILMKFKLEPAIPKHELQLFTDSILKSKSGTCIRILRR